MTKDVGGGDDDEFPCVDAIHLERGGQCKNRSDMTSYIMPYTRPGLSRPYIHYVVCELEINQIGLMEIYSIYVFSLKF